MTIFLDWDGLRKKGIPYHRVHIYRLMREKKFPQPVKLGVGLSRNLWPEHEIDAYIRACIARRDAVTAAK
jgi:predicted DNA-binding transcriptional regulator AlpA